MRKTILISVFILVIGWFFYVSFVFANGGDQRMVSGGKYFVQLSRSPFTPRVHVQTAFLISFFDVAQNRVIADNLIARIRVAKLGRIGGERNFLFDQTDIPIFGGVLEFPYTFAESGLHEVFVDFAFASAPDILYTPPDFLIDVQNPETQQKSIAPLLVFIAFAGMAVGYIIGLLMKQKL